MDASFATRLGVTGAVTESSLSGAADRDQLLCTPPVHRECFFTIEPLDELVIHLMPLAHQEHVQPPHPQRGRCVSSSFRRARSSVRTGRRDA